MYETHRTEAPVGGKHYDGRQAGLQSPVQEGEALYVQHVDFINEEHSWDELCNALVDVLIDNLQVHVARIPVLAVL